MKKILIYIFIFLVIIINGLYMVDKTINNNASYKYFTNVEETKNIVLLKNDEMEQSFIAKDNRLSRIRIYLNLDKNSSEKYNTANISIGLLDENKNVLYEYQYEKVFFYYDYAIDFEFPEIKDSKDKKYYLRIKCFRDSEISFTIEKRPDSEDTFFLNSEKTDTSLLFESIYNVKDDNSLFYIIFFSIIAVFVVFFIIFNYKKNNLNIEKKYLLISSVVSLFFVVLTPVYILNDEDSHFYRINELENGLISSEIIDNWPQYKLSYAITNLRYSKYSQLFNKFYDYDEENYVYVDMEYTSVYSLISYIPQVIGLKLGKLITNIPIIWFYIVRLFQAFCCILLTYYAIKCMPFAKEILFVIALLPSYLFATSLISADSLLVSGTLLFVAKIFELIYKKESVTKKDYFLLSILALVVSISKLVYFPISLLLFLIPYKKKNKKIFKNFIIMIIIIVLITFLWNLVALKSLTNGQGVNTAYLVNSYLKNPLSFIKITLYTFYNQVGNYISDLFGGRNNWFGNTIYDSTIIPQIFLFIFVSVLFKNENPLGKREKIFIYFIIFATYFLISTSLLISCTPVNYKEVIGIQGRYFVPLLIFIFLCMPSSKNKDIKIDYSNIFIFTYLLYFLTFYLNYM